VPVALATPLRLGALVDALGGALDAGLEDREVTALLAPDEAGPDSALRPLFRARYLDALAPSGVLLLAEALAARVPPGRRWLHPEPQLVLASLLASGEGAPTDEREQAFLDPGARVASSACVGAGAVVRSGVVIEEEVVVEPRVVLFPGVVLCRGVRVGAGSVLGRPGFGWVPGARGTTRMPHRGGVLVEEFADLGALCTVDAGVLTPTRIGPRARLDSHVHVGHNAQIGADVHVAAQSGFAGSVRVEDGAMIGGQVGVADHVTIGRGARLAARSGVIGDIPAGMTVAGYPAIERGRWLRALARLFRSRPGSP
jgi:UDP-3-O-[3-hydroxymyristoyl] glucosamine N-acyltransferase